MTATTKADSSRVFTLGTRTLRRSFSTGRRLFRTTRVRCTNSTNLLARLECSMVLLRLWNISSCLTATLCLERSPICRHIHYPVNPSSDHFHTDAVVPSSDHCRTETVLLPPSDPYCIATVAPSGDHYSIYYYYYYY